MAEIAFVNIHGKPVSTVAVKADKRPKRIAPESYHKGWSVLGVAPERVTKAEADHVERMKKAGTAEDFDPEAWIKNASLKPARTKPFEIESAAAECAALARRSGWHRVEIRRLAKGV